MLTEVHGARPTVVNEILIDITCKHPANGQFHQENPFILSRIYEFYFHGTYYCTGNLNILRSLGQGGSLNTMSRN